MKATTTFCIAFFLFLFSLSSRVQAQDLKTFIYDVDEGTNLADILLTDDGHLLMTGFTTGIGRSFFIGKYDLEGNEAWSHRKQKDLEINKYMGGSLLQTAGGYYNTRYINKKGIIAKYSLLGDLMWERPFMLAGTHIPRMLLEASVLSSTGRILAAGQSGKGWGNLSSIAYISIDTNGTNEKVHWIGQQKELNVVAILPNATGGSWLICNSGFKFQSGPTGADTYPQIYSINGNDEAVDLTKFILPFDANATSAIMTADHHIVMTGYGADSAFVLKMDTLLNVKWIKTTPLKAFFPNISMTIVKELPNGNLVVGGARVTNDDTAAPILMELDAMGNLVWEKEMELQANISTRFIRIISLPSGNLMWCGETYNQNSSSKRSVILVESSPDGETFVEQSMEQLPSTIARSSTSKMIRRLLHLLRISSDSIRMRK
jgi:hypothetical protein